MLLKINSLLTIIIFSFALAFLASSAHIFIEYQLYPQQMPWRSAIYMNGLITLLLIAAFAGIRSLIRRCLKKNA